MAALQETPFSKTIKHEDKASVEKSNPGKIPQQGTFMKLPAELHVIVFTHLGPASQRLLGATSSSLYSIYKHQYWEKDIIVSYIDDRLQYYIRNSLLQEDTAFTEHYANIIKHWLFPEIQPVHRRAGLVYLADELEFRVRIAREMKEEGWSDLLPEWSEWAVETDKIRVNLPAGVLLKY